jgi:hypothetical protein
LIRLEYRDAIADAEFLVAEHMNKPQASAIGEGFEKRFQIGTHLRLITKSRVRLFARVKLFR